MAAVQILLFQSGTSTGTAGVAREDYFVGTPVQASAVGGPYLAYQWSFLSKAINIVAETEASAVFDSSTSDTTLIEPIDEPGTYLIQLSVDSGSGIGATADDVASITFYAADPANPLLGVLAADPTVLPRRIPAFRETLQHNVPDSLQPSGNTEGWSREWYRWFASIGAIAQRRVATATSAANLRTVQTLTNVDGGFANILGGSIFEWSATSTAADDGTTVIKPADRTGAGRWLKKAIGGGGGGGAARIVWRDDGTGDATTWVDVMTLIGTLGPGVQIYVDQIDNTLNVTPAATYDVKDAYFYTPPFHDVTISIADGAVLNNLSKLDGNLTLIGNGSSSPALDWTELFGVLTASRFDQLNGAVLTNNGSVPMFTVDLSHTSFLTNGAALSGDGSAPIYRLQDGAVIVLAIVNSTGGFVVGNDTIDGVGNVVFANDGTLPGPPPTFSSLSGSLINAAVGTNGGAGPDSFFPGGFTIPLGCRYYSTDQSAQFEWNGSDFVVVDGTSTAQNTNDASAEYDLPIGSLSTFPLDSSAAPLVISFIKKNSDNGATIQYSLTVRNPGVVAVNLSVFFAIDTGGGPTPIAGGKTVTVPAGGYASVSDIQPYSGGPTPTVTLFYTSSADLKTGGNIAGAILLARYAP